MPQTSRRPLLAACLIGALGFATIPPVHAAAQPRQGPPQPQGTAAEQSSTGRAPIVARVDDANQTRTELEDLLRAYPVGRVLKLDPSLIRNDTYLASFPPLADFLAQHPEVAHNPAFYFENIRVGESQQQPHSGSLRLLEEMMRGIGVLIIFGGIGGVIVWVIKTALDHRRWSRLSRIQAEVHGKLLDRFASNAELMAYVQTPSGQRFLESGPSPIQEEPRALAAPVSRILWSLQAGVVLAAGGAGMLVVSDRIPPEPSEFFMAMGILALALGAGFVISAGVAYLLSRKLGLFDTRTTPLDRAGV
jgi:hypothetical protein